jgi:hypothetical protein
MAGALPRFFRALRARSRSPERHLLVFAVLSALVVPLSAPDAAPALPEVRPAPRPACFPVDGVCVPHYLSILALVKNETAYLAEWLEYHLIVGVDKFWIVDNDSSDNPGAFLAPYIAAGLVNFTSWPGRGQHYQIYHALCPMLNNETFWLALIDVDEFLVPVDVRSVPAVLRRLENFVAITVNWLVYGTNGQLTKKPGLVMERFRNHTDWNLGHNRFTKMIANPRQILEFRIHEHLYFGNWKSRNPIGRRNNIPMFHRPACHKALWLNHYWTKSREEFVARRTRGPGFTADPEEIKRNLRTLSHDLSLVQDVISDDRTIDWVIPLVKDNIGNRTLPVSMQRFHVHTWPSVIVHNGR